MKGASQSVTDSKRNLDTRRSSGSADTRLKLMGQLKINFSLQVL